MSLIGTRNDVLSDPIEIGSGVFWVGFHDKPSGLHCNPYLIVEGDEAVLIDGGSRPDFPLVMMKILKTGIDVNNINRLIYQHYDPDLCGSISHFESIIDDADLKIISHSENVMFIRHYGGKSEFDTLGCLHYEYRFKTGRTLKFYRTPYAHSAGSFVTFDKKSGVLFSSDLFGSYGHNWSLFLSMEDRCLHCSPENGCPLKKASSCPILDILLFHKNLMTSERSLRYALEVMSKIPFNIIAPQHGSIIKDLKIIKNLCKRLIELKNVGIDEFLKGIDYDQIGDISSLLTRN